MQERSEAERRAIMAMPQCCYLAKGAKRPSHTTNTIKFDRIPFDPSNSIKRFDLCPFDQKNSTCLQPPVRCHGCGCSCTQSPESRGTGRFGKDVSAKKVRDVSAKFSCRNVPYYLGFVFGFLQTGPNQFVKNLKQNQDYIPVCRILI